MKLSKIRLTKDASNRLRFLAGRTGLTPNLLCRIGFCLSLEEPKSPNPSEFAEEEREFNRYTRPTQSQSGCSLSRSFL